MSGWLRGPRDRVALAFGGRAVRYGELERAVRAAVLPDESAHGRLVGVPDGTAPVDAIVTLLACLERGRPVAIGADASTAAALAPQLPPGTELALLTSGSSAAAGAAAAPRAVARTNASWLASAAPLAELLELGDERATPDRIAVTGPLHVSMHLYAALHALWLGATATDEVAGAELAHATPTRLARLLDSPAVPKHVVVAGAATSDRLRAAAAARGIRLTEYYGAAELSFVAAGSGGALTPFPGVEIELREAPVGTELWVRSPYLALGVVGGGMLRRDADGFATVGDLAERAGRDDAFRILGRGDAAITTAGQTVLAEDVEARLAELPGIAAAAVLGEPHDLLGERLVAVVELEPGLVDEEAAFADAVAAARAALPPASLPRDWHVVDALPRTTSGKLARGVLRAALAAGSLPAPAPGGPAPTIEEPA